MSHMKSLSGIHQWYGGNRILADWGDNCRWHKNQRNRNEKLRKDRGEKSTLWLLCCDRSNQVVRIRVPRSLYHFCGCSGGWYQRGSMSGCLAKGTYLGATGCWAPQHQECGMGEEGRAMADPLDISACPWAGANCKELGENSDLEKGRLMGQYI